MTRLEKLIVNSFQKFQINLKGKSVLTEAATGNFVCTPLIAALSGAKVFAIAKNSKYGSIRQARSEVLSIAGELKINNQITIINSLDEIDLGEIDVVTNTGFVRPINRSLIEKLKPDCVIPLMWEPWEFRQGELDLDYATRKGIKVYGTNESDPRLNTMRYIGLTVVYLLLKAKRTPFSTKVLLIGCIRFNKAIEEELEKLGYSFSSYQTKDYKRVNIGDYETIIVAEYTHPKLIIANSVEALIHTSSILKEQLVIHISGNVDFSSLFCKHFPDNPAPFGYMSYTTDYVDPIAVIDLHSAGLKVAEGMLQAQSENRIGLEYKVFMEKRYPALAFANKKYW